MSELKPTTLIDGLAFGEGPRWHEGRLWVSDMHADRVIAVTPEGEVEEIVRVPNQPSGLGWDADGRLLVVSMLDRRLMRLGDDGALAEVADLTPHASYHCNDMVVDTAGRAYVGNFGSDIESGGRPSPTTLVMVTPAGEANVVADDLHFPNGTVITPDGRTLIVAETFAMRLTAFDVAGDGTLSGRRVFAELPGAFPDGICLDAEGAVWVASAIGHKVLRVREGGEITHTVPIENEAYACMLGGADRRTLYICTCKTSATAECRAESTGRIELLEVDVPGAGLP
jgi:sugar lactone lactonase YvrE